MADGFLIGSDLLGRIRRTVDAAEAAPMRMQVTKIPTRFEEGDQSTLAAKVFRICTFTGGWSKNASKTVTFKYQTTTPNTASATNLFAEISTATQSVRNCAIARDGEAWFLIAAEC
jgi:hypothetical protein